MGPLQGPGGGCKARSEWGRPQPPCSARPSPGSDEEAALQAPGGALWTAAAAPSALGHRKLGDALGAATLRPSRIRGTPSAVPWAGAGLQGRLAAGL